MSLQCKECCVIDFNLLQSRPAKIHDWIKPMDQSWCVEVGFGLIRASTHTQSVIVSPWRLSDHIPPQLVKETECHISTGYYSVWHVYERERETVGVLYECVSEL